MSQHRVDVPDDSDDCFDLGDTAAAAEPLRMERRKPEELSEVCFDRCPECGGHPLTEVGAERNQSTLVYHCEACGGVGYVNVPLDSESFLATLPGSEARIAIMTARYAAGLTLRPRGADLAAERDRVRQQNFEVFHVPQDAAA